MHAVHPGRLVRSGVHELEHLHELEQEGSNAATPALVIGELILFLLPVFVIVLAGSLAAYYLSR